MITAGLIEEYRRARESLLTEFPELADDDRALADTLDGETDAGDVIAKLIRDAREDEALAGGLGEMLADMVTRKARFLARAGKRRSFALTLMNAIGWQKIERPDFTAAVRNTPPSVKITDDILIPDNLCKFTRTPDKPAIKQALQRGETVSGATLNNGSQSLTILTK